MKIVFLAILGAVALTAQPVIGNIQVKASHGSVRVQADITNTPGQSQVVMQYGTTPAFGATTANHASGVASPSRFIMESGLAAETTYYFRIQVTASTGTASSSCAAGSSGPGWTCNDASGIATFTTAALPPEHGEPALPAQLDTSMPAVNGSTFNVAATCSNLQAQINACALANRSLVHQIRIPESAVCSAPTYTLPVKTGPGADTGVCIIRSAANDTALPPEGVQATDEYASAMPVFQKPLVYSFRDFFSAPSGSKGWRLMGLRFRPEPPLTTYYKVPITHVATDGVITTGSPQPFSPNGVVAIYGVTGFNGRGPNGHWKVYSWLASNKFKITAGTDNKSGVLNLTCASAPNCYAGGGYALMLTGNAISAVSTTTPPIITTVNDHGLSNEPWSNIVSASGSALTLASGHSIPSIGSYYPSVEISGSSVAAYNGVWKATNQVSGNTVSIENGPASSCSSNCGRIRIKQALAIQGALGATSINGSHLFTVVDETHLQINDASASGPYTGGGIVSFDPDVYTSDITFAPGSSRLIIDRCIFKGASQFPNRQISAIGLHSDQSGIVDSRIEGMKMWVAVNPKTKSWEHPVFSQREAYSVFISFGNVQKIHNTFIECQGICVFAEESPTPTKSDMTITRNYFYNNPVDMAGGPQSNGLYYRRRQHFELKQGRRFLIDGNIFDGGWVDGVPAAASLLFTPRAGSHPAQQHFISDITITNNTIRNTGSGIQISGIDGYERPVGFMSSRFKIKNNVFHDLDCYKNVSKPSLTEYTVVQGYALVIFGPTEDVTFEHNTILDGRGRQPAAIQYLYGRHEGLNIRHNLMTHNHQANVGLLGATGQFGHLPSASGTAKQIWDKTTLNSSFSHNVLIPGVRNTASDSSYDSKDPSATFTRSACNTYYAGFADVTCLGATSGGDSANQRHESAGFYDPALRKLRLRFDSPAKASLRADGLDAGADLEALESAQGKVRNLRVKATANSAAFSYIAPDASACYVSHRLEGAPTASTHLSDGGGSVSRTLSLNGLAAGKLYHYNLQCGSEQLKGTLVTGR